MWLRYSRRYLFHIPNAASGAAGKRVTPRTAAHRQHRPAASASGSRCPSGEATFNQPVTLSQQRSRHYRRSSPGLALNRGDALPHPSPNGVFDEVSDGYTSQREAYRQKKKQSDVSLFSTGSSAAGSIFTPLPGTYGYRDGIDEHAWAKPRLSRESRQQLLRESLESQAISTVEFTDGGEGDIELNGLPAEQFHGQEGWTTIPTESALYNTIYGVGDMESRQRTNSWSVATRHGKAENGVGSLLGESSALQKLHEDVQEDNGKDGCADDDVLDDRRRRRQQDTGLYSSELEGELLEPMQESVGQPRSTYALRKMFVDGLVGYQGMISRAEEATVSDELLHLLQDSRAAYIAEEARYCVNLYEKELAISKGDTLAFALSRCPTLQQILYRFFFWGLIPSIPNVCQVSEMVGNFSGYPIHQHPAAIGSYVGLLNLISASVLHLQHRDAPWYPRLHLTPRSLFVVTEPCLGTYAMGYKKTQQPFHSFEYATRVSKDYRIEVLFATVETAHLRTLSQAVQLSEYVESKTTAMLEPLHRETLASSAPPPKDSAVPLRGQTDKWLQQLRETLHASERGGGDSVEPLDGYELRRRLLAERLVSDRPRPSEGSDNSRGNHPSGGFKDLKEVSGADSPARKALPAAKRRLDALKTRYAFAQSLKASQERVLVSRDGPRLIRGFSPHDRRMGIK